MLKETNSKCAEEKPKFNILHMFLILQIGFLLLGGLNFSFVVWAPTIIVSYALAAVLFVVEMAQGVLGILKKYDKEKRTFFQKIFMWVIIIQVFQWVMNLFGTSLYLPLFKILFNINIALSAIVFVAFAVFETISALLLLTRFKSIGFAMKNFVKKIVDRFAGETEEKA